MRNSVLAGLVIAAILDVVALVLLWAGADTFWIGLGILFVTGFPWIMLFDLDFFLSYFLCVLFNGFILGIIIGVINVIRNRKKVLTIVSPQ